MTTGILSEKHIIIKSNADLMKIKWLGFTLRLLVLLLILTAGQAVGSQFLVSDDIAYETLAAEYLDFASSPIDAGAFRTIGAAGYLEAFWPWVMCFSAYLFKTAYAGRVINIFLSVFCIEQIYRVTMSLSDNHKTARTAARIFAYMPVTVMTCCFPIKDIFLTYASLVFFRLILDVQNGVKIRKTGIIYCAVLLICTYNTRGAVVELYSIFIFVYLFSRLYRKRKTGWILFLSAAAVLFAVLFGNAIIAAFATKIENYGSYATENMGAIALVRISGWKQLYKLPFTYFFAMLQPFRTDLFSSMNADGLFWLSVLGTLNVSIYPIAIGSFLYIFQKKSNFLFWLSTFILYSAVISLSLGIFRHYLFLLPVEIINFALMKQINNKACNHIMILGSFALLLAVLLLSLL